VRNRGRPSGRGRGRARGRVSLGRGSADPLDALHREGEEHGQSMTVAETESDEDAFEDAQYQTSPGIARSAFVTNSALPVSPVVMHRRPYAAFPIHDAASDSAGVRESDLDIIAADDRSVASANMQLRAEDDSLGQSGGMSEDGSGSHDRHLRKRQRTAGTESNYRIPSSKSYTSMHRLSRLPSQAATSSNLLPTHPDGESHSGSDFDSIHAHSIPVADGYSQSRNHDSLELDHIHRRTTSVGKDGDGDEDAEEYIVESITEHYYDAGQRYYLVKWAGYEESYDWLAEDDLTGASEVIAEYKQRIRMQKSNAKVG
jgi:hypothetical protein